ncbi:M48 family metallopeptidase [Aestuariivirga sp.]|uniref:M48 family metallopeptidase n=1 Tax=Aestuariivirga sp. TaxID=2650926 RepID=UPI0039E4D4D5
MAIDAIYFDGEYARDRAVTIAAQGSEIVFSGPDVPETRWSIAGLHPVDPPTSGQPFRVTHSSKPGARLVIRDEAFIRGLIDNHRHLRGGYSWAHLGQVAAWTGGGIVALAAIGYVLVSFLPQKVANILPDDWRNRVGDQVVNGLVNKARRCETPAGNAAKSAMIAVLAEGNPDLPPISMEVYDMQLVNAFAAPGGKIVFTRGILEKADKPEEIAGVLAHEIGHVAHRHPEVQLVRLTGLQVLISVMSGSNGGDITSNIAALATLLQYSREAEREADAFALETMQKASIDPMGLRTFFEKISKEEGGSSSSSGPASTFGKIGNIFSTHPGINDRIKNITPLPAGQVPVQVLTPEQWQALKTICAS